MRANNSVKSLTIVGYAIEPQNVITEICSSARPVDLLLIDFPRHIQALRKHFQPAADSKNAVEEIGDAVQP